MANAAQRAAMQKPKTTSEGITFTVSREKLQEALAAVLPSVPNKSTLPILSHLLIKTIDTGVTITGTDLDLEVTVKVVAEVESQGAVALPAKRLLAISKELPPAPVRFRIDAKGSLHITCGRTAYRLLTLPANEYPGGPVVSFSDAWTVSAGHLQEMIKQTSFAASTEESRPILNGVLVQRIDGGIRFVATNGHRLAIATKGIDTLTAMFDDLIIAPKALQQITRLFPADEEIEIARAENHLGIRSPFVEVFTRLIEGPYPGYEMVIPKESSLRCNAVIDRTALCSAIRRLLPVASDSTHRLSLDFRPGLLTLSVQTADVGEGQDELACRWEGDPFRVGFNAEYLLEIVGHISTDEVQLRATGKPERAVAITPVGNTDAVDRPQLYVCMPIRLLDA